MGNPEDRTQAARAGRHGAWLVELLTRRPALRLEETPPKICHGCDNPVRVLVVGLACGHRLCLACVGAEPCPACVAFTTRAAYA